MTFVGMSCNCFVDQKIFIPTYVFVFRLSCWVIGYMFKSKTQIAPFTEDAENGKSVIWAKKTAQKLCAYVVIGYPRLEKGSTKERIIEKGCMLNIALTYLCIQQLTSRHRRCRRPLFQQSCLYRSFRKANINL